MSPSRKNTARRRKASPRRKNAPAKSAKDTSPRKGTRAHARRVRRRAAIQVAILVGLAMVLARPLERLLSKEPSAGDKAQHQTLTFDRFGSHVRNGHDFIPPHE